MTRRSTMNNAVGASAQAENEIARRITIDTRSSSYEGFFDHDWASQLHAFVEGSKIQQAVWDITSSWKGTSNARRMPWLTLRFVQWALESYARGKTPFSMEVVKAFCNNVVALMGDTPLSSQQLERMQKVFLGIQNTLWLHLEANPLDLDREILKCWEDMLNKPDFALSLWKSEESAYIGVYFAYEDFVARLIGIAKGRARYELSKTFQADFVETFDESMFERCWRGPVRIGRLVRNALLHNGGRITEQLERTEHGLKVNDKQIYIMAPNTTDLFHLLKDRVQLMVEEGLKQPSMR